MSALSAIVSVLQGDETLAGILTGGVYDGLSVPDVSRQATPDAFDAYRELLPCALVKAESATPWGPLPDGGRLYVMVWLYAQHDFEAIDVARQRVYALLHRQRVSTTAGIFDVRHADDVLGAEVAALGVPTIASRYVATIWRG